MTNWNRLREENNESSNEIISGSEKIQSQLEKISLETERTAAMAQNVTVILDDLDRQFEKATKLNGTDVKFLLFATALQCIRQYIIGTITQRVDDKTAADRTKGHEKEHSDRVQHYYNPTLEEIITNPVPFDAIYGGKNFDLELSGRNHRIKTVGHDPLLGWIFGTMNIATSTITVSEGLRSYHVLTGHTANGAARDQIARNADTWKVLAYSKNKLLDEGMEGKKKIGTALMKEAIHLKSDMYSTASLPLPVISTISVDAANKLAGYGLDMGNVLKISSQAGFAVLINALIAMIHGLFYDESEYLSWNMYSVKTRKILSYSNLIASASNVIAVAAGAAAGICTNNPAMVRQSVNYLDIGGIMVTIYRIVNDRKFIMEVKKEFLEQEWYRAVMDTKIQ